MSIKQVPATVRWRARVILGVAGALAALSAVGGATAPGGKEALRKLLKLPLLHAEFRLRMDVEQGFVLTGEQRDASAEIERVKGTIRGEPADAGRHFQLFELYRQAGDTVNASNSLAASAALYRTLADAQSENAAVLAKFGRTLDLTGRDAEAESVLRRAAKLGPKEWQAWSGLGLVLLGQSWAALTSGLATGARSTPEQIFAAAVKKQIPSTRLEQAEQSMRESQACMDRAVAAAPREPQTHADRALVRSHAAMLSFVREVLQGAEPDAMRFYQAMFTTNAQPDLEQMAALAPDDPALLAKSVLFQLIAAATGAGRNGLERFAGGELWPMLSDRQRQSLRRSLTTLETLGQSGNPAVAATALEFLGGFQWMAMRDRAGAEKNLRRSIALDPKREAAWDFLMSLLVDSGRTEVALTVAEARVKAKDSARNRVAAAKTCDRLGRLDKAQAHLDAALRIAPNDYLANLVAAIITLKAGQDESSLKRAASFIERASRVEGRPASKSEWIDWTMTTGILYGLAGDADTARRKFKQVLESEPDNAAAKEGLSIVGN